LEKLIKTFGVLEKLIKIFGVLENLIKTKNVLIKEGRGVLVLKKGYFYVGGYSCTYIIIMCLK